MDMHMHNNMNMHMYMNMNVNMIMIMHMNMNDSQPPIQPAIHLTYDYEYECDFEYDDADSDGYCDNEDDAGTAATPDWTVNENDYETNSGVTAIVFINSDVQGGDNDVLAAFGPDGSVRGVATPAGGIPVPSSP